MTAVRPINIKDDVGALHILADVAFPLSTVDDLVDHWGDLGPHAVDLLVLDVGAGDEFGQTAILQL